MKEKDLVCFYKIFANLYGAILDSDAFDIIKRFYPDFTYEEFHKDLKKRAKKFDRSYSVRKWDKDSYVIKDALSIKEIRSLFILQENKPFYVPNSLEEYKKYIYYMNVNKHTNPILKKISKLCEKYFDFYDLNFAKTLAFAVAEDIQSYVLQHIDSQEALRRLNSRNGIYFSEFDRSEFIKLYHELMDNTRTWYDRGCTNAEINDFYYFDELLRPLLNKEENNVLSNLRPEEVDRNFFESIIERAKTFTLDEKKTLRQMVSEASILEHKIAA